MIVLNIGDNTQAGFNDIFTAVRPECKYLVLLLADSEQFRLCLQLNTGLSAMQRGDSKLMQTYTVRTVGFKYATVKYKTPRCD